MCSTGAITPECSPALVLGANTGSCVLELLGASRQGTEARRVRTGNTLFRIIIAALALLLMPFIVKLQQRAGPLCVPLPAQDFHSSQVYCPQLKRKRYCYVFRILCQRKNLFASADSPYPAR